MPLGVGIGIGPAFAGKAGPPPANAAATDIQLSANSVRSDALAGSVVAFIYSDGYPAPTYTDFADPDNKFTVVGNQLQLSATPGAGPHSVTIRASNGSGNYDEVFAISVVAVDTTPDAFVFTDVTGATISTVYESNTITVAGINDPAAVTVTGGEYSKNGGTYTSAAGTASLGDTFKVRATSSGSYSTAVNVALTIGGVTDTYSVTTGVAPDSTPDAFAFTDISNATLSTVYESNTITVAGINQTVTVSVTGGEYSKNGGAYTSTAGTVVNGDTVKVRHTSSASLSTATNTVLTIGGVSDTYTTTTVASANWFDDAAYADMAAVADFNNDRYAITQVLLANVAAATAAQLKVKRAATFDEFFAFTAASTASRTYTDVGGTLRDMVQNHIQFSETFDNAAWTKSSTTVTANATTAPDGTLTADLLTPLAASSDHYATYGGLAVPSSANLSVYIKPNGYSRFQLYTSNGGFIHTTVDLSTNTVEFSSAGISNTTIGAADAYGFKRVSFTVTSGTIDRLGIMVIPTGVAAATFDPIWTPDGTSGAYLWGAQVVAGSSVQTYVAGVGGHGGVNKPRFTYANAKRQLRLENAGTNLCFYSQSFDSWTEIGGGGLAVTANNAVAPDGTTTADTLQVTATNGYRYSNNLTLSSATDFTISLFVKAGTTNWCLIQISDRTANAFGTYFNLSGAGSIGSNEVVGDGSVTSRSITRLPTPYTDWYRVVVTGKYTTGRVSSMAVQAKGGDNTAPTIGHTVIAWGAQAEASAFATDYIHTPANATAGRFIETARFSPLIEAILQRAAGSVVARVDITSHNQAAIVGNDGTSSLININGDTSITSWNATTALNATVGNTRDPSGFAMGFDASGRSLVGDSGTVATDALATQTRTTVYLGRNASPNPAGVAYGDGYYDFVGISPERLPNATLQALAVAA